MSGTAVRRAATTDVGLLFDSLTDLTHCRELIATYRECGGTQPVVLIRRAWVGEAPAARHRDQVDVYAGYATAAAQAHWDPAAMITGDASEVAGRLREAVEITGADALNLRVHAPGLEPAVVDEQIAALGDVVSALQH
jgi:hypothetical protein